MKNVTISLDDESYRRARVEAAAEGCSLSAYIRALMVERDAARRRRDQLREFFERMDAEGIGLKAGENLSREQLYGERFGR